MVRDVKSLIPAFDSGISGDLAEPLAVYMLNDYTAEDWQDSQLIEALARGVALLEVNEREVPSSIMAALGNAAEAGQRVGVA